MGKTINPEKYNMVFCPLCKGRGRLPNNPGEFQFAEDVEDLDSLKKNRGSFKR